MHFEMCFFPNLAFGSDGVCLMSRTMCGSLKSLLRIASSFPWTHTTKPDPFIFIFYLIGRVSSYLSWVFRRSLLDILTRSLKASRLWGKRRFC